MNFSLILAIEFPKKKTYGSSENWKFNIWQKSSTNSLFFQLILFFSFVLRKRVRQGSGSSHSKAIFKTRVRRMRTRIQRMRRTWRDGLGRFGWFSGFNGFGRFSGLGRLDGLGEFGGFSRFSGFGGFEGFGGFSGFDGYPMLSLKGFLVSFTLLIKVLYLVNTDYK